MVFTEELKKIPSSWVTFLVYRILRRFEEGTGKERTVC